MIEPQEIQAAREQSEPLDEETMEILKTQLATTVVKLERLINLLLNRPKGLPEAVIVSLRIIKLCLQDIEWFSKHRMLLRDMTEMQGLAVGLAQLHSEDDTHLGVEARRLLAILPDAAKAR